MKNLSVVSSLFVVFVIACGLRVFAQDQSHPVATLTPARPLQCQTKSSCADMDAIVFVHGIYGSDETFVNGSTHFDWPRQFPLIISDRHIDVFRLDYQTALLSWAKSNNPAFDEVAEAVMSAMKPLRLKQYRSIGFIAHSLGGNVVSTYIHMVNTSLGHPQRSQNAFVITLATPVLGAQVADIANVLKTVLGMHDDLLTSLKHDDLYLRMLNEFRNEEAGKGKRYVCRPVDLHAAYEEKYIGPLLIVKPDSAAQSISNMVSSPVVGFPLDHIQIVKPTGPRDQVYFWVLHRVESEYSRLATWDAGHVGSPASRKLCELTDFVPEKP